MTYPKWVVIFAIQEKMEPKMASDAHLILEQVNTTFQKSLSRGLVP